MSEDDPGTSTTGSESDAAPTRSSKTPLGGLHPTRGPNRLARMWWLFVFVLLLGLSGLVWWNGHTNSPEYRARKKIETADRLVEEGKPDEAARLYCEVAQGKTDQGAAAVEKFQALLQGPLDRVPLNTAATVLQTAAACRGVSQVHAGLYERGLALVRSRGEEDPQGGLAVLTLLALVTPGGENLDREQSSLLEKWRARWPDNLELTVALAGVYERQGDAEGCRKLLEPMAERLGTSEGARILGEVHVRHSRPAEAVRLLGPYVAKHLPEARIFFQEAPWVVSARASEEIQAEINAGSAPGFPYERHKQTGQGEKAAQFWEYIQQRLKEDLDVQKERRKAARLTLVQAAAFDLGLAQAELARLAPEATRKAEMERADRTFQALQQTTGVSGDLTRAQRAYWMGKTKEGRGLVEGVLREEKRSPPALLAASRLLCSIGEVAEARKLTEEAYRREKNTRHKEEIALTRSQFSSDREDRALWLERGPRDRPDVVAALNLTRGQLAEQKGQDREAVEHLRAAAQFYDSQPERMEFLREGGLTYLSLYRVTGDPKALDQGLALLEKLVTYSPGNGTLVQEVVSAMWQTTIRSIIGKAIDLGLLDDPAQIHLLRLLRYLYNNPAGRDQFIEKVRKHPATAQVLAQARRLTVLARKQPDGYRVLAEIRSFTHDLPVLRAVEKQVRAAELDLSGTIRAARDYHAGKDDTRLKEQLKAEIKHWEGRYTALAREPRGTTFAVVATRLASALTRGDQLGEEVDAARLVRLAEEAHAAAPSRATREALIDALLFRAHRQLIIAKPAYARMAMRARRSLRPRNLVALVLSGKEELCKTAQGLPDVQRAAGLVKEEVETFPDEPTPWACVVLQATHPETAARARVALGKDEVGRLTRALALELSPVNLDAAIEEFWALKLAGKEAEGQAVLGRCAALGIPTPFDIP
jgi:tetratricopeptide (TPR) repeat protein